MIRPSLTRLLLSCLLAAAIAGRSSADVAQWDFDGDLESSTGHATAVEQATAASGGVPDFFFDVMPIGGVDADVLHFSRGTFFRILPGVGPNGGGQYVNQYTLVMDVMFPDRSPSGGWASLLQTNEANENDGDWFVNPANGIGISNNYGGSVPEGEWHRLALVLDLVAGIYTSYVDGVQVQQDTGQGLDGRFSLYSVNDGANDGFSIFADDNGDDAEGFVSSVQFRDVALPSSEILKLGGSSAGGIPIPADPRDCSFRNFQIAYDRGANRVAGTWDPLPGENGFQVFQGARQVGGNLPPTAVAFVDTTPPVGGTGVVYTLKPLKVGGAVERECDSSGIDTFGCIAGLACCADQATQAVTVSWQPAVNLAVSGFTVKRNGVEIATPASGESSYVDGSVPAAGTYLYEVTVLSGGNPVCGASCRATVTGIPIGSPGTCAGVLNTYPFDGDLKSSTGGRDLVPMISPPIDPATGTPDFSFEAADIGGKPAQVCRYSRGTYFRMYTGLGPNGGGIYTNQYTLFLDLLFEPGAIDESGWAALYQTNDANGNDADWFVRGTDRGIGIAGNYGGTVEDGKWHRLALVLDSVAGTYTSFIDGVRVQQNTGEGIDGRFTLYTINDGGAEGISLFADDSAENSAGLVGSAQIRDSALSDDEVAAFGGPSAGGIPSVPPCPHAFTCGVDQAAKTVTLRWQKGFGLPGNGFTIRQDGAVLATLPLSGETYVDAGLAPGVYVYELSLNDRESGCLNLPLTCQGEIVGENLFFEDFEKYADDGALAAAGWEVREAGSPVEDDSWTVTNPGRRANPPTLSGRASNGRFAISDSAFGGATTLNVSGSGISYDLSSPSFGTLGASVVWLHFDACAQLNNNGDAVFIVEVSTDGGGIWSEVLKRISPGRMDDPLPDLDGSADGVFGRVHLDLSGLAANKASVRLRFRHLEPTWDWWVALDNVLVDQSPAGGSTEVLRRESFDTGIPVAWRVVSGPGGDGVDPWSSQDSCSLSLVITGGAFPDAADGRQLHHLDLSFALADPFCSSSRQDEYLITPVLDLSRHARAFLHAKSAVLPTARALAEVLVSTDGGSTFLPAPIFSYNAGGLVAPEEDPMYTDVVVEAPQAAGKANVAFAFHYKTVGSGTPPGTWWAVDDVMVTGILSSTSPVFHRGDADGNGDLQLTDAVRILNVLFLGTGVLNCLDAADADDNGTVQLTDAVRILNVLFLGTGTIPPPGPPTEACGSDSGGELGCQTYNDCG